MADLTGMLQAAAGAGGENLYIEDVFSTYLYAGNGSTQTITNGIDLDGEGGLVWIKSRSAATNHFLFDTERGALNELNSNTTDAEASLANSLTAFNSDGFSISSATGIGVNAATYASWTFRKAPKFFDVVTYSGDGTSNRQIAHNLGSAPGFIIIKKTSGLEDWVCYHRVDGSSPTGIKLNSDSSSAGVYYTNWFNGTPPTDSVFTISNGTDLGPVNASGSDYVAYLFAHDAGGFGDDGSENVITCGSFTVSAGGTASITLGYEPQWILLKASSRILNWSLHDVMRGQPVGSVARGLYPNSSAAESNNVTNSPTPTGFDWSGYANETFIYIAIRRGPMKTPESGTEVYNAGTVQNNTGRTILPALGYPVDWVWDTGPGVRDWNQFSRLTGGFGLASNLTRAESNFSVSPFDNNTTVKGDGWAALSNYGWMFRRAPGFFDVVCYTGDGVRGRTVAHNFGVVPELMFIKNRQDVQPWLTYVDIFGGTKRLFLNQTNALATASIDDFNNTDAEADVFTLGNDGRCNANNQKFVAYLFATLAGISKVGTYTGTGTTLAIDCGFSAGARFVLIKRTDSTGDWYVWDSARGIVSGNDPYLLLNSTAAEVTNTDYIDPSSAGFEITSTAPAAINASGGTFIFLAIA